MIGALLKLGKVAVQEAARHVAGPCEHCARRNEEAVEAAALDALRACAGAVDDFEEGVRECAGLLVAETEAYLLGREERA